MASSSSSSVSSAVVSAGEPFPTSLASLPTSLASLSVKSKSYFDWIPMGEEHKQCREAVFQMDKENTHILHMYQVEALAQREQIRIEQNILQAEKDQLHAQLLKEKTHRISVVEKMEEEHRAELARLHEVIKKQERLIDKLSQKIEKLKLKAKQQTEKFEAQLKEQKEKFETEILSLTTSTQQEIVSLKTSAQRAAAKFDVEIVSLKTSAQREADKFNAEIISLKTSAQQEADRNIKTEAKLQQEIDKRLEIEAKLFSYDLARIYIYYFIRPQLDAKNETWNILMDELSDMKTKLDDNEITAVEYQTWLAKRSPTGIHVPLTSLCEINTERHQVAHTTNLGSAKAQQAFIQRLSTYQWPTSFAHINEVQLMVKTLTGQKFSRMNK